MVSLAQASFVTVGGFAAGWALSSDLGVNIPGLVSHGQINFLLAIVLGAVAAGLLGMLMAVPMTKLGGVSLALGTLAVAFALSLVVFPINSIRHDQAGWTIRSPTIDLPGLNWLHDRLVVGPQPHIDTSLLADQILVFLGIFGLITLAIHAFQRSASGRAILAVRSSEVAAEASGIHVRRTKILVFGFSAAIAGVGGVLLGLFSFQASETTARPIVGLIWLALAVTFGIRRPGGALIAGLAFTAATAVFHWVGDALPGGTITDLVSSVYFVPILSGLGAIQLAQEPDGILALAGQRRVTKERQRRVARLAAVAAGTALPPVEAVAVDATSEAEAAVFELRGIVGGYGDVEVVHGVDLRLRPGTVTVLLGANGAGKSTLCNIAAGTIAPTSGVVWLAGGDATSSPPFRRARDGVLYVPEARGIFPGLTVEENLTVLLRDEEGRARAYERFPILEQRRRQPAGLLSGGEQQMLSLAPALVFPPTVLVADEPTLGLAPMLADLVMEAILEIRAAGSAVLLVEEHAQNALAVADVVAFMELGRIVWSGPRAEADMELLSSAYLGAAAAAPNPDE
jgi:ABC-type branched-subunit amino acid transport system ATPase component/ABC-type branched-subunit amino acid transport system permease subunit